MAKTKEEPNKGYKKFLSEESANKEALQKPLIAPIDVVTIGAGPILKGAKLATQAISDATYVAGSGAAKISSSELAAQAAAKKAWELKKAERIITNMRK
jgi:hypothetical protein